MDTIKFPTAENPYPLVYPPGFFITPPEFYDPETGNKVDPGPTKYEASFLVPVSEYLALKTLLEGHIAQFQSDLTITYTSVIVEVEDTNVASEAGTFEVFWTKLIAERYNSQVLFTLEGYGEAPNVTIAPNQTFTVVEGVAQGTVVGTVKGFKPSLVLESRPDVPFDYQPSSGVLSVSGKLDYETNSEWVLTIGGQDVTIWVLDATENPQPERSAYTFYLEPDIKPGTSVGTVTASQQGESGSLPTYSLVSGGTGFAIDSTSGEITYLGGPLVDGQVLGVSYGGTEPLEVTLRILPRGDITLPPARFNLPATLTDGMLVGSVGASDAVASLTDPGFSVSDNKLYVQDKSQIQVGLTELTVALTGIEGRTGEQTVYVVVAEAPKINEFWVAEDTTNGTTIGTVELLGGTGGYVVAPTTLFGINSGTGELIVTNASGLAVGTYSLTVTRGSESTPVTVKVYPVLSSDTIEFTIAPSAPSGSTVGTLTGTAPFTTSDPLIPYALSATTGEITLASTPATALSFTVVDGAGDELAVTIALDTGTAAGTDFIGAVYPGQSGQAVTSRSGVRFAVGSVGFGQGTLDVSEDNLGTVSRNTEGKVVASKAPGYTITISGQVTDAMMTALKTLRALPLETPHTVAVPGENFSCMLVSMKRNYSDTNTVTLDLRTL